MLLVTFVNPNDMTEDRTVTSEADRRKLFQDCPRLLYLTLFYSPCEQNINPSYTLMEVQAFKFFGAEVMIVCIF